MNEQEGEGVTGYKLDSEVKLKQKSKDYKTDLKLTPSKIKLENEYSPEQLNSGDSIGSLIAKLEHKIGGENPDITTGAKYGLPKLHDSAGLWLEGNLTYKKCKQLNGDISGLISVNNQFFVGSQIIGNLETRKSDEITGICAAKFDDNFVYLHANCLKHIIRLGLATPQISYINKISAEAKVDLDGKGPLTDRTTGQVAFDYPINNDSKLKFKFDISKNIYAHCSFIHKINENLKLTVTDSANPAGFFKNSAAEKYKLGLALEAEF